MGNKHMTYIICLSSTKVTDNIWIVDSGNTDYITHLLIFLKI